MLHQNTSFFYVKTGIVTQERESYSSPLEKFKFSHTTTLDYTFKNFIVEVPVLNTHISGRTDLHATQTVACALVISRVLVSEIIKIKTNKPNH
jgi:hypothetical protein